MGTTTSFSYLDSFREEIYLRARKIWRLFSCGLRLAGRDYSVLPHAPVAAKQVLRLKQTARAPSFLVSNLPAGEEVWRICQSTKEETGAWPLSFSYPLNFRAPSQVQKNKLNPIFPGHVYSFDNSSDYLDNYSAYSFALTHRKSGWDCFRHLEIFASGSVPLMPDASLIPRHTMVHYPKLFLTEVADHFLSGRGLLPFETRMNLHAYVQRTLTSRAMARYLLRASPGSGVEKILFFDDSIAAMPDYQSLLTLIGLKQLYGDRILTSSPVPYIYEDWTGNPLTLYGRGFGYTRVLPKGSRCSQEFNFDLENLRPKDFSEVSLLIVGSITRNLEAALRLLEVFPASKTVWVHGEDHGPRADEISRYSEIGVTLFVRELGDIGDLRS